MPTSQDRMTTAEAARYLGCHPSTLRAWADDGLVPYERIDKEGAWRFFQLRDLQDFKASMRKASA